MTDQRPLPVVDRESAPFWEAARSGRLVLPYSAESGRFHFFPRTLDPWSGSVDLEWREVSGSGTIYSYTVVRRAPHPAFEPAVPYVVALIELDEGARMLSIVEAPDVELVRIGMRVRVRFGACTDGIVIPTFQIEEVA